MSRICPECNTPTDAARCAKDGRLTVEADRLVVRRKDDFLGMIIEGKYELRERIGRGGMGSVYKAMHRETGGAVAIKVMRSDMVDDSSAIRRFYIEAQNTHKLHHPNTVRIADFGQSDEGVLFLVMEYVKGRSLMSVLKEEKRLAPARAIHIITQIFKSLGEAHEVGIIHRDIKPDNVMLIDQFGEPDFVKVLDFGISRTLEGSGASTKGAIGTPKYMAPEQWRGERLDARADIYACGGVLYRMLTGKEAFKVEGKGSQQIVGYMTAHLNTPPRPMDVDIPESLARLTMDMLAKSADARPQDAQDMLERLRALTKEGELSNSLSPQKETSEALHGVNELPTFTPAQIAEKERKEEAQSREPANASATGLLGLMAPERTSSRQRLVLASTGCLLIAALALFSMRAPAPAPPKAAGTPQMLLKESRESEQTSKTQRAKRAKASPAQASARRTLEINTEPTKVTLLNAAGEVLGETPLTLSKEADPLSKRVLFPGGKEAEIEEVKLAHPGFISRSIELNFLPEAGSHVLRSTSLKALPRVRVSSNVSPAEVSLEGQKEPLGQTPFTWLVPEEVINTLAAKKAVTLRFKAEGRLESLSLVDEHLEGLLAIHATFQKPTKKKRARSSSKVKAKKKGRSKASKKEQKTKAKSWGW